MTATARDLPGAREVLEAYRTTRLIPVVEAWFGRLFGDWYGCALTAVALARSGLTPAEFSVMEDWHQKDWKPSLVIQQFAVEPDDLWSFARGFDLRRRNEAHRFAYAKGLAARKAVFGED